MDQESNLKSCLRCGAVGGVALELTKEFPQGAVVQNIATGAKQFLASDYLMSVAVRNRGR